MGKTKPKQKKQTKNKTRTTTKNPQNILKKQHFAI